MGDDAYVRSTVKAQVTFSMFREAHFRVAHDRFGRPGFDRVFIVHAIDPAMLIDLAPFMAARRIWWLTLPENVRDLEKWYLQHPRPAGLRHSAVGDLLHLLFGYCGVTTG